MAELEGRAARRTARARQHSRSRVSVLHGRSRRDQGGTGSSSHVPWLDQAFPLAREPKATSWSWLVVEGNVGLEALFSEDLDRRKSRASMSSSDCVREHAVSLTGARACRPWRGSRHTRAPGSSARRLLGAATAAGPAGDPDVLTQTRRRCLGPRALRTAKQRWDEAHAAGARLSFEQAIDIALSPVCARRPRALQVRRAGRQEPFSTRSVDFLLASPAGKVD